LFVDGGLATEDATGECKLTLDASGEPTVQAHWIGMLDGTFPSPPF
jgi:hypothetical protein